MPSRLPAVPQPVTSPPSSGARHDTTALLRGATASTYADTVRAVADDVADRLVSVTQPFSGASRPESKRHSAHLSPHGLKLELTALEPEKQKRSCCFGRNPETVAAILELRAVP